MDAILAARADKLTPRVVPMNVGKLTPRVVPMNVGKLTPRVMRSLLSY